MKFSGISSPSIRQRRKTFAQFFLVFLLIIALYFPSISQLYSRWIQWDQDLSHGLPTIAIFLFLVWHSLPWPYRADPPKVRIALVIVLALASVAWFLFYRIHIGILAQTSVFIVLLLFLASSYSLRTLRHLLVPCGLLVFALPLWGILNGPLVEISATVVGKLARLSGMTLLMDGNNIFIPYGRLYIDDGCSGLRYFVIALLMAYLISYLNHYRLKHTLIALGLAMVLALMTNWIRIFSLVVIGYQTEMKSSLMEDHEFFGWVLFALVMLPAIYYAPAFKPRDSVVTEEPLVVSPLLPLVAVLIGPLLAFSTRATVEIAPTFTLNALDTADVVSSQTDLMTLSYPGLPVTYHKSVATQNGIVRVELAQYVQADTDKKLVPYFRSLYDRDVWTLVGEQESDAPDAEELQFSIMKRAGAAQYHLLAHVYYVGRYPTHQYELAKLLQIPAMLLGDSYFVIFTAQAACDDPSCVTQIKAIEEVARHWFAQPTIDRQ